MSKARCFSELWLIKAEAVYCLFVLNPQDTLLLSVWLLHRHSLSRSPCSAVTGKSYKNSSCGCTRSTANRSWSGKRTQLYQERNPAGLHAVNFCSPRCCQDLFHCACRKARISIFLAPIWQHYASLGFPASLFGRGMSLTGLTLPGKFHPAQKVQGATLTPPSSTLPLPLTCHNIPPGPPQSAAAKR